MILITLFRRNHVFVPDLDNVIIAYVHIETTAPCNSGPKTNTSLCTQNLKWHPLFEVVVLP